MIPKLTIDKIKRTAKLEDVVPNLKKSGASFYTDCPKCGKKGKGKGFIVTPKKQIGKCFSCNFSVTNAIDYLMKVDNKEYVHALEILANKYNILIDEGEKRLSRNKKSFCQVQLEQSGLTPGDIEAKIFEAGGSAERHTAPFKQGTRDQYYRILPGVGDDMLIYYYDLEGQPILYKKPKVNKFEHLVRVRWQNPNIHQDKDGRPIKYQSPVGSGSHLYIPQKIRDLYTHRRPIERLFIQEGEKKAEKACKHGIYSIGIMGIQNIGYNNQLPEDLQLIIQQCEVKEVVFILDSDWNELSQNLKNGDKVDQRQRSFFYAVKNYKEYMRTLVNLGISVEIYFGYIKKAKTLQDDKLPKLLSDKGIDDLLSNTLKGKEIELKKDIDKAIHEKDGSGEYVQLHKITMMPDDKLADLWLLNDAEKFAEIHKKDLEHLTEFKIGKILRRFNSEGKIELAQPLESYEKYWEEIVKDTKFGERKELHFDYLNCFIFLQNRGFARIRMKSGSWDFVHIENKIVSKVDQYDIKDFVTEFTKELKLKDVLNMLYRGGPQYLGYEKLSNLEFSYPSFEKAKKTSQCLYFKEKMWIISADGIKESPYSQMRSYVWKEKIIDFNAISLKPMVNITQITPKMAEEDKQLIPGEFLVEFTKEAENCDFLKFLCNTSMFTWKKRKKGEEISNEEEFEETRHLINKLTAIGYLLHDFKNDSELKAVIGMDGKISEVGVSNGRTGKSLLGNLLEFVIPQVYIPAKSKKITEDQFLLHEVNEKTKNIFLDDTRANIDFEFFFPWITGKMKINPKGGQPFTLDKGDTPKMYMTTNHAINGDDASFKDRQAFVVFSDYYNETHKPVDDFGKNFFSEWDADQWNLVYNLAATCLFLYFRSINEGWAGANRGIVEPPMENVNLRRLRQQIGEEFLTWAEAYFSYLNEKDSELGLSCNINRRRVRKDLNDDFLKEHPHAARYVNASSFGKKMKFYCKYRGLHFNPNKLNKDDIEFKTWIKHNPDDSFIGEVDKSGGVEYFTIGDNNWVEEF